MCHSYPLSLEDKLDLSLVYLWFWIDLYDFVFTCYYNFCVVCSWVFFKPFWYLSFLGVGEDRVSLWSLDCPMTPVLIRIFRPFTFNVMIDIVRFRIAILWFGFLSLSFFLSFIHCFFLLCFMYSELLFCHFKGNVESLCKIHYSFCFVCNTYLLLCIHWKTSILLFFNSQL